MDGGGNSVRPTLMLLSAGLLGEVNDTVIRLAAIVEFVHNATRSMTMSSMRPIRDAADPQRTSFAGNPLAVFAGDWCICSRSRWLSERTISRFCKP